MIVGYPEGMSSTPPVVVTVEGQASGFAQTLQLGHHAFRADEVEAMGGTDTGPNPYELLLGALGACTSMTISMYARRKAWPLAAVRVRLSHTKVEASEVPGAETKEGKVDRITRDIELIGGLDDEQRQRLLDIANKCPVHKTLHSEIVVRSQLVNELP